MISGIVYTGITQGGDAIILLLTDGVEKAFSLFLTLAPLMCFWSGIMEIADKSTMTKIIPRLLSPLTRFLFGKRVCNSPAIGKITMNMSSNILGMGNAATPLGISAMKELDKLNPNPTVASDAMCMFIVINTASIQLIPSTVIALRGQMGSASPTDILLPTLITTLFAFLAGTLSAKICGYRGKA